MSRDHLLSDHVSKLVNAVDGLSAQLASGQGADLRPVREAIIALDAAATGEHTRTLFWERRAREHEQAEVYYREQLEAAHALLGRTVHQLSERWDKLNVSLYFPTGNLYGRRTAENPTGCFHKAEDRKRLDGREVCGRCGSKL